MRVGIERTAAKSMWAGRVSGPLRLSRRWRCGVVVASRHVWLLPRFRNVRFVGSDLVNVRDWSISLVILWWYSLRSFGDSGWR